MSEKKTFKALRSFTLRGESIEKETTGITGTVAEFKNLMSKGYLELETAQPEKKKAPAKNKEA